MKKTKTALSKALKVKREEYFTTKAKYINVKHEYLKAQLAVEKEEDENDKFN